MPASSSPNRRLPGLIDAAGVTTQQTSPVQESETHRGVILRVELSATAGAPAYSPAIEAEMDDGSFVRLWEAAAAIGADGEFLYVIYPGASGASGRVQESEGVPIPRFWRVVVDADTADGTNQSDIKVDAMPVV